MTSNKESELAVKLAAAVFAHFNKNPKHRFNQGEFTSSLLFLNSKMHYDFLVEEDYQNIFEASDRNGDQSITFGEYCHFLDSLLQVVRQVNEPVHRNLLKFLGRP